MKTTLFFLFMTLFANLNYAQERTMEGVYEGYVNAKYVFKDDSGNEVKMDAANAKVSAVYNLKDDSLVGQLFVVTYRIMPDLDDDLNEIEVFTIINLEPVDEDEDWDEEDMD